MEASSAAAPGDHQDGAAVSWGSTGCVPGGTRGWEVASEGGGLDYHMKGI